MSKRGSRDSQPVHAGTPLPRRQALSLGVLALGCLFDPLRLQAAEAESKKEKDREKGAVPADLRAYVERSPGQSAVVYADGVVVLNRERQLRIGKEDVVSVLRIFREAGFDDMPVPGFGGGPKRLARLASLRRGGRTKEVVQLVQLVKGEQPAALQKLVDGVFDLLLPKAATGLTAASLLDGLRKVGSAELAPQCLGVTALRKPELGRPGPKEGWLLVVEEGTATASSFSGGGFVDPRALSLDPARLARLTDALAAAQPESLPGNLYAPDYRELTAQVLNHRKIVTARPFSGMKPTQHGEKQVAFDKAFEEVEALVKESRERGRKVSPAAPVKSPSVKPPSNEPDDD